MINKLFVQKLAIAFVVGFVGGLIPLLQGWSEAPNFNFDRSAVIAVIIGLVSAGMRAVLALGPINLVASDRQHSLTRRMGNERGQASILVAVILVILVFALLGGVFWSPWAWLILLLVLVVIFFR